MKPRFQHDCDVCVFLGPHRHDEKECDLYVCDGGHLTLICRYSDDGPDYQSGWGAGRDGLIPELAEAYERATKLGYKE